MVMTAFAFFVLMMMTVLLVRMVMTAFASFMLMMMTVLLIRMVMAAFAFFMLVMMTMLLIRMVMAAFALFMLVIMPFSMTAMVLSSAMLVMMVMLMLFSCMFQHFPHHLFQRIHTLDSLQYSFPIQLCQRRCNNHCFRIVLPNHCDALFQFCRTYLVRSAQQNGTRVFNLIYEEFTEIFDIHFRFGGIYHRHRTVYLYIQVGCNILNRFQHIRQLTHSRRLYQNPLRRIGLNDFL